MQIEFNDEEIIQRERETVLTSIGFQYAILYRMLERYLQMLQNSIACLQELPLSFVRFNGSVLLRSVSV
jgi:hypothetical protein